MWPPTSYQQKWTVKILFKISIQNLKTNGKFQYNTPSPLLSLLCGCHKCIFPLLWQMHDHNTYEMWSLFYQTFEINLQLAILFIFLKMVTFLVQPFPPYFDVRVFWTSYSSFVFLSLIPCVIGIFSCLLFFCGHTDLLNVFFF